MHTHLPVRLTKTCFCKLFCDLIQDPDPNLKYLGLVGLIDLSQHVQHVRAVLEHRDTILRCLDDEDVTIRHRALALLTCPGAVSRKTLPGLAAHLLRLVRRVDPSPDHDSYRDDLISQVLVMGCREKYSAVGDFCWYVHILVALGKSPHASLAAGHGAEIARQLVDVAVRVEVRPPM